MTTPTITNFSVPAKKIGDASFNLTAPTTNSSGEFTYTSSNLAVATIVGTTITIVGVGSSTITASQASNANFLAGTITATFIVSKLTTVLTNFSFATRIFGDGAFYITAPTSNRGGAGISYTSSNTAVATIVGGNIMQINGAGTTTITATQTSSDTYESATVTAVFQVYGSGTYTQNNINYRYVIDLGIANVSRSESALGNITVLPSFVVNNNTYIVTSIDSGAFGSCSNLVSVSLPPSIATIGSAAFANCTSLTSFTIPPLVTTIDERVFQNTGLTSITIPSTVTSMLALFDGRHGGSSTGAFAFCSNLTNIVLQTYVSNFPFVFWRTNPPGLVITFDYAGVIPTTIRGYLTTPDELTTIVIGSQITGIASNAFGGSNLNNVIIPSTISTVGNQAFSYCPNLTNLIVRKYLSNFQGAFDFTNPANMKITFDYAGTVPASACINKTNLTTVVLSNLITGIENSAFSGCTSLTNITIPASVLTIGSSSFGGCTNLNSVTFLGNIPTISTNNFTSTVDTSFYQVNGETNTNPATVTNSLTMFTNKTQISIVSTTITNFSFPTKTYGDASFSFIDPSSNSTGVFTYTSSNTSIATVSGNTITIVGAGTATITANQDTTYINGVYYTSGISTTSLVVNKLIPQVGSLAISNKSLSDVSFSIVNPTKPNNNTGAWTYTSSDITKATIGGNIVTLLKDGVVIITGTLSTDSIYYSTTVTKYFSISKLNVAASTIAFVTPTIITNIIPAVEPVGNSVVLSSNIFTSTQMQTLNPTIGTTEEKRENRNIIVNTLFTQFSTASTIVIPSTAFYIPPEIEATSVKLIKTAGTTREAPLSINATEMNETTALFCPMDEDGNSVVLNGTNLHSGYSMKITKESDNNYTITKTDNMGVFGMRSAVRTEIFYYAGFKVVLGSMTGQLTDASPNVVCFKEGTQILTIHGYRPVEKLMKGDLIKTVAHGFLPLHMIGTRKIIHKATNERIKDQLYRCSSSEYSNVFGELVLTGCHSILVKKFFSQKQREKTMEHNKGRIFITDDHYRLPAFLDDRASVYEPAGTYNIYHFALENADYYMNYGVYANGLLVETCSQRYLKEIANMSLVE